MGFLTEKRILITGLLSNRSIAYGIAKAMHREGAELAFTFQGEGVRERVENLQLNLIVTYYFPAMLRAILKSVSALTAWEALGQSRWYCSLDRIRPTRGLEWRLPREPRSRSLSHCP